jgi:hypothetical protein
MDAVSPPKPKVLVEAQPFIPYMKEENFDPRLKPVLDPYKKRMGFLPNALNPATAESPRPVSLNSKSCADPTSTRPAKSSLWQFPPPTAAPTAPRIAVRC